ncbi:SPOSA6832_02803, partial [Sporobolomyces salmonicolor]
MATALAPPTPAEPAEPTFTLALSLVIAAAAYSLTRSLIPFLAHDLVVKGLKGRDMLKPGFRKNDPLPTEDALPSHEEVPGRKWLSVPPLSFSRSALDEVIASVPLLVTYAAGHGVTDIVLPNILGIRKLLGAVATNGQLIKLRSQARCTTSTCVNGVEVGQALIIALSIALNDLLYLTLDFTPFLSLLPTSFTAALHLPESLTWTLGFAHGSQELADRHLFSFFGHQSSNRGPALHTLVRRLKCSTRYPRTWLIHSTSPSHAQVPRLGLHRRHLLLLCRHGLRSGGHPWPLQQDAPPLLPPADLQLPLLVPPAVRPHPVPAAPPAQIRREDGSPEPELCAADAAAERAGEPRTRAPVRDGETPPRAPRAGPDERRD